MQTVHAHATIRLWMMHYQQLDPIRTNSACKKFNCKVCHLHATCLKLTRTLAGLKCAERITRSMSLVHTQMTISTTSRHWRGPAIYYEMWVSASIWLDSVNNHAFNQGEPSRYVFELLYKSLIHIVMNDIQHMDRAQFLTTSLTWLRYGGYHM